MRMLLVNFSVDYFLSHFRLLYSFFSVQDSHNEYNEYENSYFFVYLILFVIHIISSLSWGTYGNSRRLARVLCF